MGKVATRCLALAICAIASSCARHEDSDLGEQSAPNEPTVPREQGSQTEQAAPSEQGSPAPPSSPGPASPPFTQQLRSVHEEADSARTKKEKSLSAQHLLALFDATDAEHSPHLTSVRQDLAARAAELLLEESPERAKQSAERGLGLSDTPSVLRANLLLVLADAEEALGDQDKAKRALVEALRINQELFQSEIEAP